MGYEVWGVKFRLWAIGYGQWAIGGYCYEKMGKLKKVFFYGKLV